MGKNLFTLLFFGLFLIYSSDLKAQEYQVFNYHQLEPRLQLQNDTLYVVNFWAMWCKPCVEELPDFEKAHRQFQGKKVKFLLVSLDFGKNLPQRMHAFLKQKDITAEVVFLDDPDSNRWIGKVDPVWDGAIPATLIYRNQARKFFGRQLSYQELERAIQSMLQ